MGPLDVIDDIRCASREIHCYELGLESFEKQE